MRQTKIIATVGPASDSDAVLDALIAAGADIVRLNFLARHPRDARRRPTNAYVPPPRAPSREVAILQDLGGPKIRTGPVEGGRPITLTAGTAADDRDRRIPRQRRADLDHVRRPRAKARSPAITLLLSDGTIELRVESTDGDEIVTTVLEGGVLGGHKGINAPGIELPESAITLKDVGRSARSGCRSASIIVALSFVQSADRRARSARQIDAPEGGRRPADRQARTAAGRRPPRRDLSTARTRVMIARGDLGLEMPLAARAARAEGRSPGAREPQNAGDSRDAGARIDDHRRRVRRAPKSAMRRTPRGRRRGRDHAGRRNRLGGVSAAQAVQTLDAVIRDAESSRAATAQAADPPPAATTTTTRRRFARPR